MAPSRVQWYSKLHHLVCSVCFLPCDVRVRPPSCSVVPQSYTLSRLVSVFCFFICYWPHTRHPSKRETKKILPLRQEYIHVLCIGILSLQLCVRTSLHWTQFCVNCTRRLYMYRMKGAEAELRSSSLQCHVVFLFFFQAPARPLIFSTMS